MTSAHLKPGVILTGKIFPEPVEVISVQSLAGMTKVVGIGKVSGQARSAVLHPGQLAELTITSTGPTWDGDPHRFRLGVEALQLGLAYEYDPFFALSVARIDPLPHQLEAVYEYFLKVPRIRFLLADDPGAGKTIMAGLLLKELKIRGLVKRTLIVTPANLTFQWQREMKDKFREDFEVLRGDVLRANYGANPWQEKDQVVTSVSWVSVIDDARESLLRSRWDLIIVDEAHKMAAYDEDNTTLAWRLGRDLGKITDHYLLMTATPHKGDPENFRLFLQLLDPDVYGSIESLQEAMTNNRAPFYLRRVKEALVTFPDPHTGEVKPLYKRRDVKTVAFDLSEDETDFYQSLTRYVEDQSIKANSDDSARGRAIGFTMAMLQRRLASSLHAAVRTLERMRDKRKKMLEDPDKWRKEQLAKSLPANFDELTDEEQTALVNDLEGVVPSLDPAALREDIRALNKLLDDARELPGRRQEEKLLRLRQVVEEQGLLRDKKCKLLVFTEHKDTLDFLAGDGREGRPFGKLREWGLRVTQIHGGMKVGARDQPGTRLGAEQEFRDEAQVLVATEAAGEGINLQFCWLMVNYDLPWSPVRLEQRMGRIHRYGQQKDCLVLNLVARNTNEGRVLHKLLERLDEIRRELGTDQVFDVVGEILPANLLEKLFRDMYAGNTDVAQIEARVLRDVDVARFRRITHSTLEGLARKQLNLGAIVGRTVEARERRLSPTSLARFFAQAAPVVGLTPRALGPSSFRVGRVSRALMTAGVALEPRHGRLAKEYANVTFDAGLLAGDSSLEWVTPGHPLFEALRDELARQTESDLAKGSCFVDLDLDAPVRVDLYRASIRDGRGNAVQRRLYGVASHADGTLSMAPLAWLDDVAPAPPGTLAPPDDLLPDDASVDGYLIGEALMPLQEEVAATRGRDVDVTARHLKLSMEALIQRADLALLDLEDRRVEGTHVPGLDGLVKQARDHLDTLQQRYDQRRHELSLERELSIGEIDRVGRFWVLPDPRAATTHRGLRVDRDAHAVAVAAVVARERALGHAVDVAAGEHRGFDLVVKRPDPRHEGQWVAVRFVTVKVPSVAEEVVVTERERRMAETLRGDAWIVIVSDAEDPTTWREVQDPAALPWRAVEGCARSALPRNTIGAG
jgi:superfamily II DNA or RNA helicase